MIFIMLNLPTELALMAQLRAISARGDFYTILCRGYPHSGLILLKWRVQDGVALYIQERDFDDGTLKWRRVPALASPPYIPP